MPSSLSGRTSLSLELRVNDIFDFRFLIADWLPAFEESIVRKTPIGNRQSTIGNDLAVAEGFEPSHGRINSAVPYQLGYATREFRIANCELRI